MATTTGYDIDEFYTRASDGKGHSANRQVTVSTALAGMIDRLVQSKAIPSLASFQDVARDALIHRMRYVDRELLKGNDFGFAKVLAAEAQMSRIKALHDHRRQAHELIEQVGIEITVQVKANQRDAAWNEIEQFEETCVLWADDPVYVEMQEAAAQWKLMLQRLWLVK